MSVFDETMMVRCTNCGKEIMLSESSSDPNGKPLCGSCFREMALSMRGEDEEDLR